MGNYVQKETGNLYKLRIEVIRKESLYVENENEVLRLWHSHFDHLSYSVLGQWIKGKMVNGINENLKQITIWREKVKESVRDSTFRCMWAY